MTPTKVKLTTYRSYMTAISALLAHHDMLDLFFEAIDVNDDAYVQQQITDALHCALIGESKEIEQFDLVTHDLQINISGSFFGGYIRVYMAKESGDIEYCRVFLPE